MSTVGTAIAGHSRRTAVAAGLTVIIVLAVVGVGTALALRALGIPFGTSARDTGVHHISDDVPTSFGIVAVEYVRTVDGVTHRSLNGASHGVSGLVEGDHVQIQTAVAITNRSERPISYTTAQFRLLVTTNGKTTAQEPSGGDLPNMRILPHAGIEGHLSFTVPRTGAQLALEFTDPGRPTPILIDLGPADFAPQSDPSHSHN
jgi:hypothetical protein